MTEILHVESSGNIPTYTIRRNQTSNERGFLLLHGLTGDERSMWALEPAIPEVNTLISPRGIYRNAFGGYSWTSHSSQIPVAMEDFQSAVDSLADLMNQNGNDSDHAVEEWFLMGFSQGAACAFALAASAEIEQSVSIAGIIAIAGFLPAGDISGLIETPIYWGHGLKDELVPIRTAREGVERLRSAGIHVDYCEADVGHKLGSECLKGLKQWYQDLDHR